MKLLKVRARKLNSQETVFGYFFHWIKRGKNIPMIGQGFQNGSVLGYEVDINSIERSLGEYDNYGVEIFEGDRLKDSDGEIYTVEYGKPEAAFILVQESSLRTFYFQGNFDDYTVIQTNKHR